MKRLNLLTGGGKMHFTYLFYQHIMFRKSCGNCHFCNTTRPSDITIADFWGWEKSVPDMNKDDKGVSLVFVNTEKGRRLFEAVKQDLDAVSVRLEDCLQPNLRHPSVIHPKREQFEQDYQEKGFEYVMKHYGNTGWRFVAMRLKRKVKRLIKSVICGKGIRVLKSLK